MPLEDEQACLNVYLQIFEYLEERLRPSENKNRFIQTYQESLSQIARQQVTNARLLIRMASNLQTHPYQIRGQFFRENYMSVYAEESSAFAFNRYCLKDYLS